MKGFVMPKRILLVSSFTNKNYNIYFKKPVYKNIINTLSFFKFKNEVKV